VISCKLAQNDERRLDGEYALDLTSQLTKANESYQVHET
jgi:hypothetical protein